MRIHNGDNVVIITGKDKGKTGSVLKVLPTTGRIVVSGINMRTKHIKATPQQAGQKIQYEGSIAISNVMVVDPKSKKRTRVGFEVDDKGKKKRVAKRSGEIIEKKKIVAKKEAPKAEEDVKIKEMKEEKAPMDEKEVKVEKAVKEPSSAKPARPGGGAMEGKEKKPEVKKEEVKKEEKKPEVKKTEKVAVPPAKKPFWKKMLSFGGAAAEEAEVEGESHMKEDRSIPGETPPHRHQTSRGS